MSLVKREFDFQTTLSPHVVCMLGGHKRTVLDVAVRKTTFASCDTDGVVLLWSFINEMNINNILKLDVNGRCVLSTGFVDDFTLACAQGDGIISLWDLTHGVKMVCFNNEEDRKRNVWPVVNSIISTKENNIVCGDDNGCLTYYDIRTKKNVVWRHRFNDSITSLLNLAEDRIATGTACGEVHVIDVRMMHKTEFTLSCSSDVISGLGCSYQEDKLITYSTTGNATLIDTQPFALSNDKRILDRIKIVDNDEVNTQRELWRCDWCCTSNKFFFPTGADSCVMCSLDDDFNTTSSITVKHSIFTQNIRTLFTRSINERYFVAGGYNGMVIVQTEGEQIVSIDMYLNHKKYVESSCKI